MHRQNSNLQTTASPTGIKRMLKWNVNTMIK